MRVIIARCSVVYSGRLETALPSAVRAVILKEDGSVAVHSDDKAYKPLNWMSKTKSIYTPSLDSVMWEENHTVEWEFGNPKETLVISFQEIISDTSHSLDKVEPGLTKVGTENHLQLWLSNNPSAMGAGWVFVAREYPTGAGPVDLLMLNERGEKCAVEVKRVASIGAIDQVSRYVEALVNGGESLVNGIVVAFDVRPPARALAESRGFTWREIDKAFFLSEISGANKNEE